MSPLQFGNVTVIVKGYTLNNGIPYFQRAVPSRLRERLGKATIKIRLLKENGNAALQCHRLYLYYETLFRALDGDPALVPSETKVAAIALLATHGLSPGDALQEIAVPFGWKGTFDSTPHLNEFFEGLQGYPIEKIALKALRNELPVLLSEAFTVYLENNKKGHDKAFQKDQKQHWDKLIAHLGDVPLETLTREQAKAFRDARLATGIKTTTLKRELNVIRSVINSACNEIPLHIKNPFDGLVIQGANQDKTDRESYTKQELSRLFDAAQRQDDEKRRIVMVLALTGARLAEIVGLRKQDVDLENGTIHIRAHKSRSLKTGASNRIVPLLPLALQAVKKQVEKSRTPYLFPTYASEKETKADSASATLNKWAKGIVPGKTMHSLRHTLRDQLRAVMCPESISKEIGGWSATNDISVSYGQGYPMEVKREWLEKGYAWLASETED